MRLFELDLRSLACCRVCTATLLIGDRLYRLLEYPMHYGPHGILPREAQFKLGITAFPNLHLMSDFWLFQVALWAFHLIALVALGLGFSTRATTVVVWYFQLALMNANYLVNNGGDALVSCLLFWCIFLPWGQVWSLDAISRSKSSPAFSLEGTKVRTMASLCLTVQVCLMYWVSVYHKMEPNWLEGKTLYFALGSDFYSRPTRIWLLEHPQLLSSLTYATLVGEVILPVLLIAPWPRLRWLTVAGLTIMHVSFGLFLRLGTFALFPALNLMALSPGPWFPKAWNWLARRTQTWRLNLQNRMPTLSPTSYGQTLSLNLSLSLCALLFYSVLEGINHTSRPRATPILGQSWEVIGIWTGLEQRWAVFIGVDQIPDGWVLVRGTLRNGRMVDLFHGRDPFRWDRPLDFSEQHNHYRWPTPLVVILSQKSLQPYFLKALAHEWNQAHDPPNRVSTAELIFMKEQNLADFQDHPATPQLIDQWREAASDEH